MQPQLQLCRYHNNHPENDGRIASVTLSRHICRKIPHTVIRSSLVRLTQTPAPLTFRAIIALPAGHTNAIARLRALVVTERIVTRPAQIRAALAVVVLVARHPEVVLQPRRRVCRRRRLRCGRLVAVLRPFGRNVQHTLDGEARDQRTCDAQKKKPRTF